MFNEYNIKVFDYIFSKNLDKYCNGYIENENCCIKEIDRIIITLGINPYDFWQENKYLITEKTILDSTTFDGNSFIYNKFPNMTLSSKSKYLEYKVAEFKKVLEENPNYTFKIDNLRKDFNIENILGIKEIIDKCIEDKIIISDGIYWSKMPNTKYGRIDEEKLSINMNNKNTEITNKTEVNAENIIIMNDKSKINKSDFSKNKKETEKESILDKILKIFKNLFKKGK